MPFSAFIRMIQLARCLNESRCLSHHRLIDIGGGLSCLAYAVLTFYSWQRANVPLLAFVSVMVATWALTLLLYCKLDGVSDSSALTRVLLWAILFRICGFVAEPILEDDYFRYLWDGRTFALSGNPYQLAPLASFHNASIPDRFQIILDNINNPDIPTIYGPVCQLVFLLSYWLSAGSFFPLKLLIIAADLSTVAVLARWLPLRNLLLYAWCPLLIKELSFSAHIDGVGVFLMVMSLAALRYGQRLWPGALLAFSAACKPFSVLLVPFYVVKWGWSGTALFVASLLGIYAPFLLMEGSAGLAAMLTFFKEWEFNSSLYALASLFLAPSIAKFLSAVLFGVFYIGYFIRWRSDKGAMQIVRGDWIFGMLMLCSAVVNPWYLLWLLPFVAIYPSAWGIAALAAVSLAYIHGGNLSHSGLDPYHHPWWVRPLEFGAIVAALIFGAKRLPTESES